MNTISEGGLRGGNKKERENANWGPPQPLPLREHQRSFTQRCGRWGPNIHGQTRAPLSSPPPNSTQPPPPIAPHRTAPNPTPNFSPWCGIDPETLPSSFLSFLSTSPPLSSFSNPPPPLVIIRSWHLLRCLFPSPRRNLRPPPPPPSPPLRPLLYRDASEKRNSGALRFYFVFFFFFNFFL